MDGFPARALLLCERPDFDGASGACGWDAGGELEDGVVVVVLDQVEGAKGLSGVGEGAFGFHEAVVLDADGGRLLWWPQPVVTDDAGGGGDIPVLVVADVPLLGGGVVPGAGVVVDEKWTIECLMGPHAEGGHTDAVLYAWFDQLADHGLLEVPLRLKAAGAQAVPVLRRTAGGFRSLRAVLRRAFAAFAVPAADGGFEPPR
jgi:hypothetical protein